jgi:putative membrane protein
MDVVQTVRRWFVGRHLGRTSQTEGFSGAQEEGTAPDYRFSLANERTFLAWIRTGLALIGGGLAVAGFLPRQRVPHLREVLAVTLMVLGSTVAFRAIDRWARVERAMRLGQPLPRSRFTGVLALLVGVGGLLLAVASLR